MTGTLKNGQKFDAWVRFTEGYRKTNGRWLAIHHISVPVDLDTGKALLTLKPCAVMFRRIHQGGP